MSVQRDQPRMTVEPLLPPRGSGLDPLLAMAAFALASGDALRALNCVALREDAPALAIRGIAMAQLGDLVRARSTLRKAARMFGPADELARARCSVAEAELALVCRDLGGSADGLERARATLEAHGDRHNAAHARNVEARRLLLMGLLAEAEHALGGGTVARVVPALRAMRELIVAGIAVRRLQMKPARAALARAARAAQAANHPGLAVEVQQVAEMIRRPAARLVEGGQARPVLLDDVELLFRSPVLVFDACRNAVRAGDAIVSLAKRPILFMLARALGEAWPAEVTRDALIAGAFRGARPDESHRARLRVEIARLRHALRTLAKIGATPRGFALSPLRAGEVVVLAPPIEGDHAQVLALLADGEAWSSSALALALGMGARTVQRALEQLASEGKAVGLGRGRARRWMSPPPPGFPTSLLLPGALPHG